MEFNSDIKKLEMQEHEYKLWSDYLAKHYPEVTYVEGDKDVVNHGVDKPGDEPLKPFGRRITGEEFAVIRKERFAEEGWDCLADVKPSYWEFRDVYYKEADAALVAEAYHAVTLQYAKPDDLSTLMCNGPIEMMDISCSDLMNLSASPRPMVFVSTLTSTTNLILRPWTRSMSYTTAASATY